MFSPLILLYLILEVGVSLFSKTELNLKFIPTGGVNLSNCLNYINTDFVLAIGSGWIAPKELIRSKKGKIFALEDERKITGALGFLIGPALEDGVLCCTEAFWYVDEKHRGAGLKLLNKFESYAKSIGCKRIGMVHLENSMPDKLKKLYTRKKYKHIESMYLKEL